MLFEKYNLFAPNKFFNSCHGANIIEMPNHDLWVSFFAGTQEKAKDVGSWRIKKPISINPENNKDRVLVWGIPTLFYKYPGKSHGACHFFIPPEKNEIWIFFNLMHGSGWSTCNTARYIYRKGSWSEMGYLRRMIGWNTNGIIQVLDNGDYLHAMFDELLGYKCYFRISKNKGRSWKTYGPVRVPQGGCLEPSVVQLEDKSLLTYMRTKNKQIWGARSYDRGRHWTKAFPTYIPNPDSMVKLQKLPDNSLLLVYNHSTKKRENLAFRRSFDGGKTWGKPIIIDKGNEYEPGEVSYPSLIIGSDGYIHIVYTNGRKTIAYVRFDMEWINKNCK